MADVLTKKIPSYENFFFLSGNILLFSELSVHLIKELMKSMHK